MGFFSHLSPLKSIGLAFGLIDIVGSSVAFSALNPNAALQFFSSLIPQFGGKNAKKNLENTQPGWQNQFPSTYPADNNMDWEDFQNQPSSPPLSQAYSMANPAQFNMKNFSELSPEMQNLYVSIVTAIRDPKAESWKVIDLLDSAEQDGQGFYNVVNSENQNLLHYAAGTGNSEIFFFLCKKLEPIGGMRMCDNKGLTPFDVLLDQKHFDLILEWIQLVGESPEKNFLEQDCQSLLNAFINMFQGEEASQNMLVNLLYRTFQFQLFNPYKMQGANLQGDVYKNLLKRIIKQRSSVVDKMLRFQDNQGNTLLLTAIIQGDFPLAKELLEGSGSIQKLYGKALLMELLEKVDSKKIRGFDLNPDLFDLICRTLQLSRAFEEDVLDHDLFSSLVFSLSDEQFEKVLPLLSPIDVSLMALQPNENNFSLFEIIAADTLNNLEKVKALMPFVHEKYVESLENYRDSLLHELVQSDKKLPILKQIFQGVSEKECQKIVLLLNHEGETVFDIAEAKQADETLKYLMSITIPLKKIMDWSASDSKNKWLQLAFASVESSSDDDGFSTLSFSNTQKDSLFSQKDRNGNTPLHAAASGLALENLSFLLEIGMDFEAKNKKGQQPLYLLFQRVFAPIHDDKSFDPLNLLEDLQMILEKVLSNFETREQRRRFINFQDPETKNTFLHEVVRHHGTRALVSFLQGQGAVNTIQNAAGKTAKDIARETGDPLVMKLFP